MLQRQNIKKNKLQLLTIHRNKHTQSHPEEIWAKGFNDSATQQRRMLIFPLLNYTESSLEKDKLSFIQRVCIIPGTTEVSGPSS